MATKRPGPSGGLVAEVYGILTYGQNLCYGHASMWEVRIYEWPIPGFPV